MARVIPPNFDYQPNDTSALNWDEAPPAPDDYDCVLGWSNYNWDWDNSYEGLFWAPEIRDRLFKKFGVFGTFRTPVLLDEEGFQKICYLIVGDDDLRHYADGKYDRQSLVTTKLPKNYLPFIFARSPLDECARNRFLFREGSPHWEWKSFLGDIKIDDFLRTLNDVYSKRSCPSHELMDDDLFIDEAGQLVKTNDHVRLVNYSETELNGTIGKVYYHEPRDAPSLVKVYVPSNSGGTIMSISTSNLRKFISSGTNLPFVPPKFPKHVVDWSKIPPELKRKRKAEQDVGKNVGLCDLSTDLKQHIASYLPLFDVELNLRRACRDTFWNIQKPPSDNVEYDFVSFSVSAAVPHGDYETGNLHEQWQGVAHATNDVLVAIWNHDWMMEDISITLKFVKFDRNHCTVPLFKWTRWARVQKARLDPLGCHYCGVQQASQVELNSSTILLERCDDRYEIHGAESCTVFRHCRDWTPREPRIQLRHIGLRKMWCGHCSNRCYHCRCFVPSSDGFKVCMYYSPKLFENSDEFVVFSAPSDSRDKNVILFSEVKTISFC